MSRAGRWLAAAAACALLGTAQGAQYQVGDYKGRRVLVLQGTIEDGEAQRFAQQLDRAGPLVEVLLDSPGGSERDGLAIGRMIRKHGLSTRIPGRATCASACADVFLGGVARRVEPGGRYGIHMATIGRNPKLFEHIEKAAQVAQQKQDRRSLQELVFVIETLSAQAAARWAAFVLEMGASPRIVDAGTKYGPDEMNFLKPAELKDLNVVNVDD